MAMKLLITLLPILSITLIMSINVAAAAGATGMWSINDADPSTEESHIELPDQQRPESYIALPGTPESYITLPGSQDSDPDDGGSGFVLPRLGRTCDKYPQVCRKKSSPGPDCCKKKCTNVKKDSLNCGQCGLKCNKNEMCCNGSCVNTSSNDGNCGSCGTKCNKWETCVYGMCSYA